MNRNTRTSALFTLLFLPLFGLLAPSTAAAQEQEATLGAVLGYEFELEAPLVGIDARYIHGISDLIGLGVQLQGNYFFTDSFEFLGATVRTTLLQFDLNLLAEMRFEGVLRPYVGAGPALLHARTRATSGNNNTFASSETTDMGFNVVLGTSFVLDQVRPFVQVRATAQEETYLSAMVGASFVLY